jgi:hypothetical protein
MRFSDLRRVKAIVDASQSTAAISENQPQDRSASAALTRNGETMKLIPWEDIWTSLRVARIRGNGEMIEVFYDTLFKEAVFDDDGAWSFDQKQRFYCSLPICYSHQPEPGLGCQFSSTGSFPRKFAHKIS